MESGDEIIAKIAKNRKPNTFRSPGFQKIDAKNINITEQAHWNLH